MKEKHSGTLIEMHNVQWSITTGTPTYFMHNWPHSFDELWGNECMWNPMGDLLMGRAHQHYYRRLAYDIPTYLCNNLKEDNEHGLMFWYYASVVQHYGIGGKHPDLKVWEIHKEAVRTYKELRPFYVHGEFYGVADDESVHAHTRADLGASVLNLFNFTDAPVEKVVRFTPGDIGLPESTLESEDCPVSREGDTVILKVELAPFGHKLLRLSVK